MDMEPVSTESAISRRRWEIFHRPMLYEEPLKWFIFLSAMDLLFTCIVLYFGGVEVNWLARQFLEMGDLYGLMAFKFHHGYRHHSAL
jgi:hypothetical protein